MLIPNGSAAFRSLRLGDEVNRAKRVWLGKKCRAHNARRQADMSPSVSEEGNLRLMALTA